MIAMRHPYHLCLAVVCFFLLLAWPLPGQAAAPSALQDVRYRLNMTYDVQTHTLDGTATVSAIWHGAQPLTEVYFFLPPNTLRRRDPREPAAHSDLRYPLGFDPASLTVHQVINAQQQMLAFGLEDDTAMPVGRVPDQGLLRITLPRPYQAGERVEATIAFTTRLPRAKNWGHYRGIVALEGFWYPVLVPYRQGRWIRGMQEFVPAHYTLTLATTADQDVVASVPWTKRIPQQDQQLLTGSAGPLYHLGLSLSPHWQRFSDLAHDPPLHILALPQDAPQAESLLDTLRAIVTFYRQTFQLTLDAPFTIVVHERDASWPYIAPTNNLLFVSRDLFRVPSLIHKLVAYHSARGVAYQWWRLRTTYNQNTERWIGEGLTTYMALRWLDDAYGAGRNFLTWQGAWLPNFSYQEQSIEVDYRLLVVTDQDQRITTPVDQTPSSANLRLIYQKKGALIYAMLHDLLGQENFLPFLDRLAALGPFLTTADVRQAAEAVSSQDLAWFFQQWVAERAHLDYAVGNVSRVEQRDTQGQTVHVNQVEIRRLGDAVMPVTVRLLASDGSVHDATISGTAASEVVTWESATPLSDVQIDPERRLPDVQRLNNTEHLPYTVRPLIDFPRLDRYLIYPFVLLENNFIDGYIPRLLISAIYLDEQSLTLSVGYKENTRAISVEGEIIRNRFPHPKMSTSLSFSDRLSARTLSLATSLVLPESRLQHIIPANIFTLGYRVGFLDNLNEFNREPVPDDFAPDTGRIHSFILRYARDTRIPITVGAPLEVFAEPLAYGYALRLEAEIASEALGSNRPDFQQFRGELSVFPRLWNQTRLRLRIFGGWSEGTIPLQRKFSLAGLDTVRGYDYSLRLLGDRLLGGSVGLRFPVLRDIRVDDPWRYFGLRGVHIGPFFDVGWIWDTDERLNDVSPRTAVGLRLITAIGFGSMLRFEFVVDVAHPIDARGLDENEGVQVWFRLQSTTRGGLH